MAISESGVKECEMVVGNILPSDVQINHIVPTEVFTILYSLGFNDKEICSHLFCGETIPDIFSQLVIVVEAPTRSIEMTPSLA